jgi:hypothetical protein
MVLGQRPNRGPSPKILGSLDGGAEPRLTSGGEAGANGVKFQDRLDLQDGISHPAAKPQFTALKGIFVQRSSGSGKDCRSQQTRAQDYGKPTQRSSLRFS